MTDTQAAMLKGWGERLRSERVGRGLTQDQVAELAKLHLSTVSRVESGTAGLHGYAQVARALGVKLEVAT